MRRRSTFVHSTDLSFDPKEIQLKGRQLLHPGIKAAREERLTFGFKELPTELVDVLQQSHELHIRWSSESPSFNSVSPFLSRLNVGLHVFYTPLKGTDSDLLCPLLRKAFSNDLKCHSSKVSFTAPDVLSGRFASTASSQYYSVLPSLSRFVAFIQRHVCPPSDVQCFHDAGLLNIVDHLDLDYDSISHALTMTAYWSKAPPALYDPVGELTTLDQWPLDISSKRNNKVEVGVLMDVEAIDAHDIQLAGYLTVVGEDKEPKPVQFSFPSRHHTLSESEATAQGYTVSFQQPTGLHPILEISFTSANQLKPPTAAPDDSICALHAYFILPSSIFADEYAFSAKDPLFEQSHNLRALRSISGELDLEAPDYVVGKWGSTMLLELATPEPETQISGEQRWTVTVPLHLRYQPPAEGGLDEIRMPWPVVFWACTAEEGTKFPVNPFDRVNLGYDGVFGARTMFYHLKPHPGADGTNRVVESIKVPILDTSKVGGDPIIENVTLIVILLGFGWVLFKLWLGLMQQLPLPSSLSSSHTPRKTSAQKKEQ